MEWKIFSRGRSRPAPVSAAQWSLALERCRYARALSVSDRRRLRDTMALFLRAKSFDGAVGFAPTAEVRAVIALKACVPILNLGMDYYAGWRDIVVYPGDFRVEEEYTDDAGVVHRETSDLCGQSLTQGPMVLSWQTIEEDRGLSDHDVVIHECAHKLDILNGEANGFPPPHAGMSVNRWARAFSAAFDRLQAVVNAGPDSAIDPYAAADPAEFFAVLSETFFTRPAIVYREFPAVYAELAGFYRQDPRAILRDGQ